MKLQWYHSPKRRNHFPRIIHPRQTEPCFLIFQQINQIENLLARDFEDQIVPFVTPPRSSFSSSETGSKFLREIFVFEIWCHGVAARRDKFKEEGHAVRRVFNERQ